MALTAVVCDEFHYIILIIVTLIFQDGLLAAPVSNLGVCCSTSGGEERFNDGGKCSPCPAGSKARLNGYYCESCPPGYEPSSTEVKHFGCRPCPVNTYKRDEGNDSCRPCPLAKSTYDIVGSLSCFDLIPTAEPSTEEPTTVEPTTVEPSTAEPFKYGPMELPIIG